MTSGKLSRFTLFVIGACLVLGCSEDMAVTPSATPEPFGDASASASPQAVPGTYQLSFVNGSMQPVSTLPAGSELVLHAYVQDSNGSAAQRGSVKFQFCALKGGRSLGTNPVPSIQCESGGTAAWITLITFKVDAGTCPNLGTGNACVNFGFKPTPGTIGFRFLYTAQGSSIANGTSLAADFTWL
jgi:hypothetical protein